MGSNGVGATLTAGIQDIAALLPLLGTEQCEDHVSSALTKGYLYSVATPLSIFGSLGMARAGLKTFLACADVPKYNIVGAHWLANMGFKPQGTNLPLLMIMDDDAESDHHDAGGCYCCYYLVQRRVDEMVKELHIDRSRITDVIHKCAVWNIKMMAFTAVACLLSITPYIYVNTKGNSTLSYTARWVFPVVRALGGFLTATMIQLVMQIRIVALTKRHLRLTKPNRSEPPVGQRDVVGAEKSLESEAGHGDITASSGNSFLAWVFLTLLLCGVLALVVGYIGCFSTIQSATTGLPGPISWLCLEAGLSILRLVLWGFNPTFDDAPDLEIELELDQHAPVATCMKDDDMIATERVLPLMRASEFLTSITSFGGLIRRFTHPDLTLYYTLTRRRATIDGARTVTHNERILYVTIFDHKERTTRVYTRDSNQQGLFFSAGALSLDVEHDQLETMLGGPIIRTNDPVVGTDEIWGMLRDHYQSIVDRICRDQAISGYSLVNKWTLKAMDTVSRPDSQRQIDVEASAPGATSLEVDQRLLELALLEKKRRSLLESRGEWNEKYMRWVVEEMKDLPRRVDNLEEKPSQIGALYEKVLLFKEAHEMEMLLVKEVEGWEKQLLERMRKISDGLDDARKRQLGRVWSQSCWKRLDWEKRQMEARLDKLEELNERRLEHRNKDDGTQRQVYLEWESLVQRYVGTAGSPLPLLSVAALAKRSSSGLDPSSPHLHLYLSGEVVVWMKRLKKDMWKRLIREGQEIDQRLAGRLESCDRFQRPKRRLFRIRHFPSDLLFLDDDGEDPDVYLQELKRKREVVNIICSYLEVQEVRKVFDAIRTMPWVTSIALDLKEPHTVDLLSVKGNAHLLSITGYCHFNQEVQEILARNQSNSDKTFITRTLFDRETIISFVGPQTGTITLRLVHFSESAKTISIRGPSPSEPPLSVTVPISLTIDDITLHPSPSEHLSFHPKTRNTFTITSELPYFLRDIYILDSVGNPYNSPLNSPPYAISSRTVSAGNQLDVERNNWSVLLGSH